MLAVFVLLCLSLANAADLVSNALGSFMVLQRGPERAQIWGTAVANSQVTVTFSNQKYVSTASANGSWAVLLPPTPAGGPYDIQVTSSTGLSQTLQNVLFGDVYVCSGQSNMQFTVSQAFNASKEINDANLYPDIRVFTVGQGTVSETPLSEFATISQRWSIATSKSIGVGDWSEFSAVCWFFGRDLHVALKVPIGLVSSNWGGTIVQAWSSPDAMKKCPTEEHGQAIIQSPKKIQDGADPNHPTLLWNAMIVPLLPMTIKGATWYQGESNSGQPQYYACAFPAMIADWRLKWSAQTSKTFGFYFVQLAPWTAGDNSAEPLTRLSQLTALNLPSVGFAVAADLGDRDSPFGSIHPRDKQTVGTRLSTSALAITYGQNVQYLGPMALNFRVVTENPPMAHVEVNFEPKTIGGGLAHKNFVCPVPGQCAEYELLVNGAWKSAEITAQTKTNIVVSIAVSAATKITGVRYGWANYPTSTLYNTEGFPAVPFSFPDPIKQ